MIRLNILNRYTDRRYSVVFTSVADMVDYVDHLSPEFYEILSGGIA